MDEAEEESEPYHGLEAPVLDTQPDFLGATGTALDLALDLSSDPFPVALAPAWAMALALDEGDGGRWPKNSGNVSLVVLVADTGSEACGGGGPVTDRRNGTRAWGCCLLLLPGILLLLLLLGIVFRVVL